MKPNDLFGVAMSRPDILGPKLHDWMMKATHSLASMTAVNEDLPLNTNQLQLSRRKDRYGMPLISCHYQRSPEGDAMVAGAIEEGVAVVKAAGAQEVWHSPFGSQHLMGGTVMGTSAKNSVTNSFGQTHEIDNLYIGGGSLFPTGSSVNTTYSL